MAALRYADDIAIAVPPPGPNSGWTYEDYAEAVNNAYVPPQGPSSSSAGAWLGPPRPPVPRPPPAVPAADIGLPLSLTSGGGCYQRVGCSQLVHCTSMISVPSVLVKPQSSGSGSWCWALRYHTSSCSLRHSGGVRYTPCKHCMPGLRNRRGNGGG